MKTRRFGVNPAPAATIACALALTMGLGGTLAADEPRDDFLDDFIVDIPLRPLDEILVEPDGNGTDDWRYDFFGDPGEAPQPDTGVAAEPQPADDPAAEVSAALPEGWHQIDAMGLRLSVPPQFELLRDPDGAPVIMDGGKAISHATLEEMTQFGAQGKPTETLSVFFVGRSPRRELTELPADDPDFVVLAQQELVLSPEVTLEWLTVEGEIEGFFAHSEMLETTQPLPDGTYLNVLAMITLPTAEAVAQTQQIIEHIALSPDLVLSADPDPREALEFFDGALQLDLPEGWRLSDERANLATFTSVEGYQGFATIETGERARIAADLEQTFTGAVTESRGEVMGLSTRIFAGRQHYDAFLEGFSLVPGDRFLALPEHCLPTGEELAITWAGAPRWHESGAFERLFDTAQWDGLVPCAEVTPPPAQPDTATAPTPEPSPPVPAAGAAPDAATTQDELTFWQSIMQSQDPADLQAYLDRWPEGTFAPLARARIAAAQGAGLTPSAVAEQAAECAQLAGPQHALHEIAQAGTSARAIDVCRAAIEAHLGDADSAFHLGRALYVAGHSDAAAEQFGNATEAGHLLAAAKLAGLYAHGDGVSQDLPHAEVLYRQALAADEPHVARGLAALLLRADHPGRNEAEAVALYRQAAEAGDTDAMLELALLYRQGRGIAQSDAEAVRWYRPAAEAGNAQAMNNLGFMYSRGLGVAQDHAQAAHWHLRAAEAGHGQAMNNIGVSYLEGRGVAQDIERALHWFRRGAEQGNPSAMNNLGLMYAQGQGVAIDQTQAIHLYRRSAKMGHAPAMAHLGQALAYGRGAPADPDQAADWLIRASDGIDRDTLLRLLPDLPAATMRVLQARLAAADTYQGAIDGVWGPGTRRAVILYLNRDR